MYSSTVTSLSRPLIQHESASGASCEMLQLGSALSTTTTPATTPQTALHQQMYTTYSNVPSSNAPPQLHQRCTAHQPLIPLYQQQSPSSSSSCTQQQLQQQQPTGSHADSASDGTQVYHISSTTSSLMHDIQNLPTVTSHQIHMSDPNLRENKSTICSHPLYPFISELLEKCEMATANPDHAPLDTFEKDFAVFLQNHETQGNDFLVNDDELDPLMVKAVQVLRIHLVELKKVTELCKDFCTRYINCLRTKIQSDPLIQDSEPSSPADSDAMSPLTTCPGDPYSISSTVPGSASYMGMMNSAALAAASFHRNNTVSVAGGTGMPLEMCSYLMSNAATGASDGSGAPAHFVSSPLDYAVPNGHHQHLVGLPSSASSVLDPSKQKRGVLPKKATQVMKQWLFQHLVHPYPTEDEKRHLASQTNLTLLQVNNWFINARRRILQPMLDANNAAVAAVQSATASSSTATATTNTVTNNNNNGPQSGKRKCTTDGAVLEGSSDGDSLGESASATGKSKETSSGTAFLVGVSNKKKKCSNNKPNTNRFWPASLAEAANISTVTAALSRSTGEKKSPTAVVKSEKIAPTVAESSRSTGEPPNKRSYLGTNYQLELDEKTSTTTTTHHHLVPNEEFPLTAPLRSQQQQQHLSSSFPSSSSSASPPQAATYVPGVYPSAAHSANLHLASLYSNSAVVPLESSGFSWTSPPEVSSNRSTSTYFPYTPAVHNLYCTETPTGLYPSAQLYHSSAGSGGVVSNDAGATLLSLPQFYHPDEHTQLKTLYQHQPKPPFT